MSQDAIEIKYYFCKHLLYTENITTFKETGQYGLPTFAITPKDYFDTSGFLYDSSEFDPKIPGFNRVADSIFEYVGIGDPEEILLKNGTFMWRDMLSEIKYTYRRRSYLNRSSSEPR